jgi:cell envelope opacity-associated protein A
MPVIDVATRFILNLGDDVPQVEYSPGRYEVSDEVAEHWYVKANLVGAKPADPGISAAQKMLLVQQAVRMAEPVSEQAPAPIAQPGVLNAGAKEEVYFAGTPQSDEAKAADQSKLSLARGPKK